MIPKQSQIEIPLLQVLNDLGGEGIPKEIFPHVTAMFPDLTLNLRLHEAKALREISS